MSYNEFASVYDKLMKDMPYDQWLTWIEASWLRFGKPGTAAELGCGTGTITLPLAERGLRMYGVDQSPDMLALAAAKAQQRPHLAPGTVYWMEQDMVDLQLPDQVDAIYAFCDSLNYIADCDDMLAMFRNVRRHLQSGGIFCFDVWSPAQFARYGSEQPFIWDEEQLAYIWTCHYHDESRIIEHELTIFVQEESGLFRKIEETHIQKAYPVEWIEAALQTTGFSQWEFTADFTDESPNGSAQRVFVIAVA